MDFKKGDIVELNIEKFEIKGKGLARKDNLVFFVSNTVPGQFIKAKIFKIKKNFVEADLLEIVKESPITIEPKCRWFKVCGGCRYQNIPYEVQLQWKKEHVIECLSFLGGFKDILVNDVIKSPREYFYRNKIELSAGLNEEGEEDIGFFQAGDYNTVLQIDECKIFDERLPTITAIIRDYLKENKIKHFDFKTGPDGYLQYIVFRKSYYTDELQINFITREGALKNQEILIEKLKETVPVLSFFHTENFGGVGYSYHTEKRIKKICGNDFLIEKIGDKKFKISPFSFFQTNSLGAEKLYDTVKMLAKCNKEDIVLDLYCGTGTISQYLASSVKEVKGIEIVKEAVLAAQENMILNDLDNCSYEIGDARKILKFKRDNYKNLDIIITDPPRSGMVPKALMRMIELRAKRIVYVSCNPAMLARDLKVITANSYQIEQVQPVDMFPHTYHVETVVALKQT